MDKLLQFIQSNMNLIINLLGALVTILLIVNASRLNNHKSRIADALNRKNTRATINKNTLEIDEKVEEENVTPETIRSYEKEFHKTCSWYNVLSQLIPVFPLFGILGTVAGLMLQVSAQNFEGMFESLELALGSTFWGLIWAILLKILAAVLPSRTINDVEIMLEDYDKKFNNILALKNITE